MSSAGPVARRAAGDWCLPVTMVHTNSELAPAKGMKTWYDTSFVDATGNQVRAE